jgi:hypothetical protein
MARQPPGSGLGVIFVFRVQLGLVRSPDISDITGDASAVDDWTQRRRVIPVQLPVGSSTTMLLQVVRCVCVCRCRLLMVAHCVGLAVVRSRGTYGVDATPAPPPRTSPPSPPSPLLARPRRRRQRVEREGAAWRCLLSDDTRWTRVWSGRNGGGGGRTPSHPSCCCRESPAPWTPARAPATRTHPAALLRSSPDARQSATADREGRCESGVGGGCGARGESGSECAAATASCVHPQLSHASTPHAHTHFSLIVRTR